MQFSVQCLKVHVSSQVSPPHRRLPCWLWTPPPLAICNGQFSVSTGVGCIPQLFNKTLIWVWMGIYLVDVIRVYDQFTLSKKDYLP